MPTKSLEIGRKKGANPNRLNDKQRIFVDEYLANGMNATEAARVAGYSKPNRDQSKLLRNPAVRSYLEREITKIAESQLLRRAQLVSKMQRLNDFNLMKYAIGSGKGNSIVIDEEHYAHVAELIGDCVTKVKVYERTSDDGTSHRSIEIELMPKFDMFKLECQYMGMLTERKEVTVSGGEDLLHTLLDMTESVDPVVTVEGFVVGK